MVPGKDQIVLQASEQFKDALGKYATENKLAMAEVIRRAVATVIGYDLSTDPVIQRHTKYFGLTEAQKKQIRLHNAMLLRWGKTALTRMLDAGEIDAAKIIARAVNENDYETLEALKDASTASEDDEAESGG